MSDAARRAWLMLVCAVLACFAWQTIVVQSHVHAPAPTTFAADHPSAQASARPDTPATCPLCRALAHAGRFLAGSPPLLGWTAIAPIAPISVARPLAEAGRQRSHAWQGRAPPTSARS